MDERLAALIRDVAHATTEHALAAVVMDRAPLLVRALATGYYAVMNGTAPAEIHVRGLPERTAVRYEREGRRIDPLFRWATEHHASAVMDLEMLRSDSPAVRKMMDEELEEAGRRDLRHYVVVPLVVAGAMVGTLHFASTATDPPDLAVTAALSSHVSARLAALRAVDSFRVLWDGALTPREAELATLAARGLTTCDMGRAAGVTANTVKKHLKKLYAKLGVASRAELSIALLQGPQSLQTPGTATPRAAPDRRQERVFLLTRLSRFASFARKHPKLRPLRRPAGPSPSSARHGRFERPTYGSGGRRSIQLS